VATTLPFSTPSEARLRRRARPARQVTPVAKGLMWAVVAAAAVGGIAAGAHPSGLQGADAETLSRYLRMIQVQRQDFNGRVLTIRRDDMRAIAAGGEVVYPTELPDLLAEAGDVAAKEEDPGVRSIR